MQACEDLLGVLSKGTSIFLTAAQIEKQLQDLREEQA